MIQVRFICLMRLARPVTPMKVPSFLINGFLNVTQHQRRSAQGGMEIGGTDNKRRVDMVERYMALSTCFNSLRI